MNNGKKWPYHMTRRQFLRNYGIASGAKETAAGIAQTKVGVQSLNEAAASLKAIA